jgi:SAM-dependent methyltransferase
VTASADPREAIQGDLLRASNYNGWIADMAGAHVGERVVDAGAGAGNIAALLLPRDAILAVEVWPPFVRALEERFGAEPGVRVFGFDLTDPQLADALREHRPDSVMCSNVLEHVEDDGAALRNLASALPPGAPFFLLVPAFPVLYGVHDRADHHFRRYTKRSLARTVEGVPLEIERMRYLNLPGFFAWFLLGRVLRRQLGSGEIGFYDRLIPAIRAVESRVPVPFGQSLVALMRTTGA